MKLNKVELKKNLYLFEKVLTYEKNELALFNCFLAYIATDDFQKAE